MMNLPQHFSDHACFCGGRKIRNRETIQNLQGHDVGVLMPSMPESGPHSYWTGRAKCKATWENTIDDLGRKIHRKRGSNDNDNSTRTRSHNSEPPLPPLPPYPPQQQRSDRDESTHPSPAQRMIFSRERAFRVLGIDRNASRRKLCEVLGCYLAGSTLTNGLHTSPLVLKKELKNSKRLQMRETCSMKNVEKWHVV